MRTSKSFQLSSQSKIIPMKRFCIQQHYIRDNGIFPNNSELPVFIYRSVLRLPLLMRVSRIRKILNSNNWGNSWKGTVYDYHHYHSITHEVLAVYKGNTSLQLGGDNGIVVTLKKGDVIIIPAGVAHKNMKPENTFKCVGAYPNGSIYDMNSGKSGERPQTDENISRVRIPECDPVFGKDGEMLKFWHKPEFRKTGTYS